MNENPHVGYGSLVGPLGLVLWMVDGPVLELGAGNWSTPILAGWARAGRNVWSVDNNPEWVEKLRPLKGGESHRLCASDDIVTYAENLGVDWGVVLIDQDPVLDRLRAVEHFRNKAKVLVIHDTEILIARPLVESFRFWLDWQGFLPWTSVVSDRINISGGLLKGWSNGSRNESELR